MLFTIFKYRFFVPEIFHFSKHANDDVTQSTVFFITLIKVRYLSKIVSEMFDSLQ